MDVVYLSAIAVQAWWRGILARRRAKQRRQAVDTIRRYKKNPTLTRAQRIFQTAFYIKYMLLYRIKDKRFIFLLLQVHQGLHLPPQGALSRERVLPGLCSLLIPDEAAQEPSQKRPGQKLAHAPSCSHRGTQEDKKKEIYLKDHVFCFVSSNGVKTVVVFRHRSIYESCACRTWCGATVRRSVLSGSTRSVSSQHLSLRVHCVDSYASSNCHDSSVNRWSRRRSPVNCSRTRRTTTPRVSPNSFSAQDSVRCTRTAALKDE